jgi:putative Holliday junction resolvase
MSSRQVERMLIDSDVSRSRRKGIVDKLAAQVILQSYLDAQEIKSYAKQAPPGGRCPP